MKEIKYPQVLFDGVCNLCNGTVDFILKHDRKKQFRFASLQSKTGEKKMEEWNIEPEMDSVILISNNKIYFESEAVLGISKLLPFPWNVMVIFKVIPVKLRDKIYRWIAKNRYRWFGKRKKCRIPSPEERIYFLDDSDL